MPELSTLADGVAPASMQLEQVLPEFWGLDDEAITIGMRVDQGGCRR